MFALPLKEVKKYNLCRDKEMWRQEHYLDWLSTQNLLDSMRYDDLQNTGESNIPNCDKRPAYSRYLYLESPRCSRLNAFPGPSHPGGNDRMGDDPSELSDDLSLSDSTYRPDESENTETTTLDTEEEESFFDEEDWKQTHCCQCCKSNSS